MATKNQQRIFLWIIPRTCSTVLSKCMTFVDGVQVWMEPYMACHMNDTCYNPTFGEGNVGYKFAIDKLHAVETSPEAVALREEMQHLIDSTPGVIDQTNIRCGVPRNKITLITVNIREREMCRIVCYITPLSIAIVFHLHTVN